MSFTAQLESTLIAGVTIHESVLVDLKENKDSRGSFTEIFQQSWETVLTPVQWSMVKSETGVFRGMHYHRRHDEYFCLVQGSCYLGLKDMRPQSPTYLDTSLYFLCAEDMKALVFPSGVLHGWYFPEPSMHIQSVSESYLDYGAEDNYGCKWNDPELDIPWPFDSAIVSERTNEFGSIKDLPPFYERLL